VRVLLVADGYPPVPGGLEAHVERLARYLHDAGHEIAVVTTSEDRVAESAWEVVTSSTWLGRVPGTQKVGVRQLPPPWPDPGMVQAVDRVVLRLNPDVIHAHGWCSASAGVVARRRTIPLVVTLHDYGMFCPMRTLLNAGQMCSHTAGIRCVRCPGSDQSLVKRLGLGAGIAWTGKHRSVGTKYLAVSSVVAEVHKAAGLTGAIAVVPNFIDISDAPFSPPPESGSILFVGPSTEVKGFDVLLDAHRRLLARRLDITLHHVGGAVVSNEDYVVRSGRLRGAELAAAYNSARVVVVPSKWQEPCPTVALEAMEAGRAIVASNVGGLIDIVESGVTGQLVPASDPEALADALEILLKDERRLEAMGRAGRTRVTKFSTATVGPIIEEIYRVELESLQVTV
jgi:glycosyltransferase involved in cell wall biosynthesis